MRALARLTLTLTLALAASLVLTLWTGARLATDPAVAPWRDAAASEIIATTEALLAEAATPEALTARITDRLSGSPRDWIVLDALTDLASARGIDTAQNIFGHKTVAGVRQATGGDRLIALGPGIGAECTACDQAHG